jgi:hypothetical protein
MARLLSRGEFYEKVSAQSVFEEDFERLLVANAADLYPSWHCLPFKQVVESEFGPAKSDLALVDRKYRRWWVVEVELASHSLHQHVEPQVRSLATGAYISAHAEALHLSRPDLELRALKDMVLGEQPRVLVLVNESRPDWIPSLHRWNARLGVVEIFRSSRNVDVLRVNGEHPDDLGNVLTNCRVDALLRRSLVVGSPAALPVVPGGRLEIIFEGGTTQWRRIQSANCVWLMPVRRSPLPHGISEYQITQDNSGKLILIPLRRR